MSLEDFYDNVRLGQRLLSRPAVETDSTHLSPGALAATLARADMWLSPRVVKGYSAEEMDFLAPEERDALDEAVAGFKRIARDVPADAPATPEQGATARRHLEAILQILQPNRFRDPHEWVAARLLDQYRAAHAGEGPLADLRYRFESNFDGDRFLVVYLILEDDVVRSDRFYPTARGLEAEVERFLMRRGAELTPSFRVRSASEQAGMRDLDDP
jgi:hypothetical protein